MMPKLKYLASAAWSVFLISLDCLMEVYFDKVRWVEFNASVSGAATLASAFMIFVGVPQAAKPAAIATAIWTAIMYLRNPKKAGWQGANTVSECLDDHCATPAPAPAPAPAPEN